MNVEESILERVREIAYKHALLNAYKHNGRAELKPVISKIVSEIPEISSFIREIISIVQEIVNRVNSMSIEKQREEIEKNWPELLVEEHRVEEKKLPPLPNAVENKVVTRFAPNPDYTIHLGNARPVLLSYWYAEIYKGKMILRFEDTDPRIKSPFPEAYVKIKEDIKWLGVKWSEEYIQSMRLPIYYDIARELIKANGAYVDKCSDKEFKKYRNMGKACPHRNNSVENNLEELDKILENYYSEGEAVIRVKTDMKHPDPSIRDWVALRIIDTSKTPHPVVGDKYNLWPTYNYAAAVDDHLMGVTHILRAKEHVSNTIKQKYLYDHMKWTYPETIHFGRLSLEGVILSKSKMRKMILEQNLEPYDDPRFGTLSGLRRRGFVKETIWEIVRQVGVKSIDARISFVNLAAINRSFIDSKARRYMAVENPISLLIELESDVKATILRNPATGEKYEYFFSKGVHTIYISRRDLELFRNNMVRLMGFANIVLEGLTIIDNNIGYKTRITSFSQEDAVEKNLAIIQWVSGDNYVEADLITPTGNELVYRRILVERDILNSKVDDIVQFYRIGFARIDRFDNNRLTCIFSHE
ncbi:MAG: glutamate--tRNA ligase [Desulfurococcaceae archaeon]